MSNFKLIRTAYSIEKFNPQTFNAMDIGIEIQGITQEMLNSDYISRIKQWQEKLLSFNGVISFHASTYDLNPASVDPLIREISKKRYIQAFEIARDLKCKYVIIHSQANPLLKEKRIKDILLNNLISFWNELIIELDLSDINILIENVFDDTYEEILYLLTKVNSKNIGVCLDIGHILAYSNQSITDWVRGLNNYIKYVHLHWNNGEEDTHRPPSEDELISLRNILNENLLYPMISLEYVAAEDENEIMRIRQSLV